MKSRSKAPRKLTDKHELIVKPKNGDLFDRVVSILEQARANVVRAVNSNMVIAYWLIGREIVQEIQGGEDRAEYGKEIVKQLSDRLTKKYDRGFSATNLWYFRQFYLTFSDRNPEILRKACGELVARKKLHKSCGEFDPSQASRHKACDVLDDLSLAIEGRAGIKGFSPTLSWSHYRTLVKVENRNERLFYEIEAEKENWSVPHLDRQIHTLLFARLLKSRNKAGAMELARAGQTMQQPVDAIKHPYVLDFLDLPDGPSLHESGLEAAIMNRLQPFLLGERIGDVLIF